MTEGNADVAAANGKQPLGADLIIPLLAAAFTIYFLVDTSRLVWEARANGTAIGVVLLILVSIQIARIAARVWRGEATLGLGALAEWNPIQAQRLGLLAATVLFVATIPWLGTTLGLFAVMFACMWILGVRSFPALLGISAAVAAIVYVLFILLLQSRLPVGPIENFLGSLRG